MIAILNPDLSQACDDLPSEPDRPSYLFAIQEHGVLPTRLDLGRPQPPRGAHPARRPAFAPRRLTTHAARRPRPFHLLGAPPGKSREPLRRRLLPPGSPNLARGRASRRYIESCPPALSPPSVCSRPPLCVPRPTAAVVHHGPSQVHGPLGQAPLASSLDCCDDGLPPLRIRPRVSPSPFCLAGAVRCRDPS